MQNPENPRNEPCYLVNFELWQAYCAIVNREPLPSEHWTEADVVVALDRHLGIAWPDDTDLDHRTV
jgi:hypothetical protein